MKKIYFAPEATIYDMMLGSICTGSGDSSYEGVTNESITTGEEISFD